jgi:hypothetical protein
VAPLTRADVASAAAALLADGYSFHLVSHSAVLERLDTSPFGLPVVATDILGPRDLAWDAESFMRVYNRLNRELFGPNNLALDGWVMVNIGLLASAFLIIALPFARLEQMLGDGRYPPEQEARLRERLAPVLAAASELGFDGPIPLAGYSAAAMPTPGHWLGWSLCSMIPGLGTVAKGLALEAYRATTLTGVAQYANPALHVHRKFGRMRILKAVLALHPVPGTLVYQTDVYLDDDSEQTPTSRIRADDVAALDELEANIVSGRHVAYILPPGLDRDGRVPILETSR